MVQTTLSAGLAHSLVVRRDGSLWAWGSNHHGQLGVGDSGSRCAPARVGTDSDWAAVSAAGFHSLALKRDGSLWAWGYNNHGQLGLDNTEDWDDEEFEPARVGTGSDWAAVSAGDLHSLAVKRDGSLWVWGYNNCGQLGLGNTEDRDYEECEPVRVGTGSDWAAVSAGGFHSLAVKGDGGLWGWGRDDHGRGQLGDGGTAKHDQPIPIRALKVF
jgi:alpha-tubulin suppressor-like RCC1 family protein